MPIDCLLKLFKWKISGSCAFRVAQNITMSVSGTSNFEFQILKLLDITYQLKVCRDSRSWNQLDEDDTMKQLTWINLKIYVLNYKIKGVYYFVSDFDLYEVLSYEFKQKFSLKFLENTR